MLVKWHPGARARHTYVTDRLWFCHLRQLVREFGQEFRVGGDRYPRLAFVPRVAHTPYFDGVKKAIKNPLSSAFSDKRLIEFKLTDPTKRPVRQT
jgi:hypothetical protein